MTHEKTKAQEAQRRFRANSWQIQKVDRDPPTPTLLLFHGATLLLDVDADMHSLESWTGQRAEVRVQRDSCFTSINFKRGQIFLRIPLRACCNVNDSKI